MITYVLTISQTFPAHHPKRGESTNFKNNIARDIKRHTIRSNYELWKKRFIKINAGVACLSVRVWTGKPYRSEQKEVFNFDKSHGIGFEMVVLLPNKKALIGEKHETTVDQGLLSFNDGLTQADFQAWFPNPTTNAMVIIHFTKFRYINQ